MFFIPSQIREIKKKTYFPEETSFFLEKSLRSFSVSARRPENSAYTTGKLFSSKQFPGAAYHSRFITPILEVGINANIFFPSSLPTRHLPVTGKLNRSIREAQY
jgi:hypothetical protein